jgi:membrane protease YdiL (CAAX protease family)
MILLLRYTGSLRRASAIQAVLFGMAHVKGLGAWAFVDVFTVISIGFTYAAYKTRSLVAGGDLSLLPRRTAEIRADSI